MNYDKCATSTLRFKLISPASRYCLFSFFFYFTNKIFCQIGIMSRRTVQLYKLGRLCNVRLVLEMLGQACAMFVFFSVFFFSIFCFISYDEKKSSKNTNNKKTITNLRISLLTLQTISTLVHLEVEVITLNLVAFFLVRRIQVTFCLELCVFFFWRRTTEILSGIY